MASTRLVSRLMIAFGLAMLNARALAADAADLVITEARVYTAAPEDVARISRDILALADAGKADDIRGTAVIETWFEGKRVYRIGARAPPHHR